MLQEIWETEEMEGLLKKWNLELAERIELRCYQALVEIKGILEDDTLTDAESFMRMERMICVFEKLGSGIDGRHDFG